MKLNVEIQQKNLEEQNDLKNEIEMYQEYKISFENLKIRKTLAKRKEVDVKLVSKKVFFVMKQVKFDPNDDENPKISFKIQSHFER